MIKGRRIGAFLVATAAACAITSLAAAAPARAATPAAAAVAWHHARGPQPVNPLLDPVRNGDPEWAAVQWTTDRQICHAELTVRGNSRVDVRYPDSTRYYSSFANGSTLSRGETDFTAFRVTADFDGRAWSLLVATLTYDDCGRHARTESKRFGFILPVRA